MARRKLFSRHSCLLLFSLLLLSFPPTLLAQENAVSAAAPPRDPQALAERFLAYEGAARSSPLTPVYRVNDRAEFWVGKNSSETPVRVQAVLAGAASGVYIWVEDGIQITGNLQQRAQQLGQLLTAYRQSDNYRELTVAPQLGTINDPSDLLPVPDIDNDPHLYILYTSDLREDREAVLNPLDSLPVEFAPYSNQHEMLYLNTSPFPDVLLSDPLYLNLTLRAIYRWIMTVNIPEQPRWLTEMFNWALLFSLQQSPVPAENLTAYLQAPDTALFQPPTPTTQAQVIGGQQLFLAYLLQRFGGDPYVDLFMSIGKGIEPLDTALAGREILDPATGTTVTGRDVFADFVLTNVLNFPLGDGRYVQGILELPQRAAGTGLEPPGEWNGLSVNQFGTQYYLYIAPQPRTLELTFEGSSTVARLPMPFERDPANRFYWSGSDTNANPTLTRNIDLTEVEAATLTFDAWYNLTSTWNYGYVSLSTDDGATWEIVESTNSSADNRNGVAYGVGFTHISSTAEPRPFPILGIVISSDNITVTDVSAGSPAAEAGVRPGDVIIGYDSQEWVSTPNVIGLLANYAPGDTLNLYIQRGSERLDVPVLLGAHPTRIVEPAPVWLEQTVDLTPFAGEEILLRFETVTLPGREDQGFAVDNLAIPEIEWDDDAENNGAGWVMDGWQQIDNQLRQQWLVQAVTGGTDTIRARVQRLLNADDADGTVTTRFALGTGETLVLAVSGVNDDTIERATFNLALQNVP